MFKTILDHAAKELKESLSPFDENDIIELASKQLIKSMKETEEKNVQELTLQHDAFIQRNRSRWKLGFQKLHSLREVSREAGMEFQKQFLSIPDYSNDPLLGVLMRQHANACRISGEIIHLLEGGYPDAALARWRTLFEIAVTCLVIQKYGREAAIDYINDGEVRAIEGMEEHQKTAVAMKIDPFSESEMNDALDLKERIINGSEYFHWAIKYTGSRKLSKLMEHVGLDKWSHNYKLASKNIHAHYSEMLTLFAMSEAKEDMLLTGQSNSGMTSQAHFTAISLSQITTTFLSAYIHEDTPLNYTNSSMFMKLITNYVDEVGEAFSSGKNTPT